MDISVIRNPSCQGSQNLIASINSRSPITLHCTIFFEILRTILDRYGLASQYINSAYLEALEIW
jgi:hypothetical protein